jgi:uncharacterized protein YuzB (UPF0349 family)
MWYTTIVIIQFCKKSIERLGAEMKPMLSALRDQEHTVTIKDCLERCQACDKQLIIATADGTPVSAVNPAKILATVAALAEDS